MSIKITINKNEVVTNTKSPSNSFRNITRLKKGRKPIVVFRKKYIKPNSKQKVPAIEKKLKM